MEYVTLNNGIKMPKLGYGVYQTPAEDTKRCVLDAIEVGYRSIDTAQAYYNEEGVGAALKECGLPREEFFHSAVGSVVVTEWLMDQKQIQVFCL